MEEGKGGRSRSNATASDAVAERVGGGGPALPGLDRVNGLVYDPISVSRDLSIAWARIEPWTVPDVLVLNQTRIGVARRFQRY